MGARERFERELRRRMRHAETRFTAAQLLQLDRQYCAAMQEMNDALVYATVHGHMIEDVTFPVRGGTFHRRRVEVALRDGDILGDPWRDEPKPPVTHRPRDLSRYGARWRVS